MPIKTKIFGMAFTNAKLKCTAYALLSFIFFICTLSEYLEVTNQLNGSGGSGKGIVVVIAFLVLLMKPLVGKYALTVSFLLISSVFLWLSWKNYRSE
jgi:hypothetical protein